MPSRPNCAAVSGYTEFELAHLLIIVSAGTPSLVIWITSPTVTGGFDAPPSRTHSTGVPHVSLVIRLSPIAGLDCTRQTL